MSAQWYLYRAGLRYGPYAWQDLVSFAQAGNLASPAGLAAAPARRRELLRLGAVRLLEPAIRSKTELGKARLESV
jgi:hypothetical protein